MQSRDSDAPQGYVRVGDQSDQVFVPATKIVEHGRLALSPEVRIAAMGFTTLGAVTVLGILDNYKRAALRFRAENAHRLPRSEKNWFYYHRAKSYYAMASALPYGLKLGLRTASITTGFLLMEEGVDHARGGGANRDCFSTAVAGMSTAGLYSIFTRQTIPEAGRLIKSGLFFGLAYGILEDAVTLISGQRLAYVDRVKRAVGLAPMKQSADAT